MCDCSICFENLNIENGNFIKLRCKHEFHCECIFNLLITNKEYNNKCPLCRHLIINSKKRIIIKTPENQELVSELLATINEINNIEYELKYLKTILLITLLIAIGYMLLFYYNNMYIFYETYNFIQLLMSYLIYAIYNLIGNLIGNLIYPIYSFLYTFITSIIVLSIFTIVGYGPLFY